MSRKLVLRWLKKKVLRKFTPSFIRHPISYLGKSSSKQTNESNNILSTVHIASTKVLLDRFQLLDHLPKGGIVAEVGVAEGRFSEAILARSTPNQLHLIDSWDPYSVDLCQKTQVEDKFCLEISKGKVLIHHGTSIEIGSKFPDEYFDWVYLDTDHSYETTKQELHLYSRKIKNNGIIAGHDLTKGNFEELIQYGVIEAVFEFCQQEDWILKYLTMELNAYPSFAIQRR